METIAPYTIGIDGLPLGDGVAIVVGGRLHDTFTVEPGELAARVASAMDTARTRMGGDPSVVRLVLVDDGGDGSLVTALGRDLATRGVAFEALDLIDATGIDPVEPTLDLHSQASRSLSRAIGAALAN